MTKTSDAVKDPQTRIGAHSQPGLRINLGWALDLLQSVPGTHQDRILSRKDAQHAAVSAQLRLSEKTLQPETHISNEELGRGTWTFLHTLAAQWPQEPSRQQKKDARTLIDVMTRIYPCASCASHFGTLVKKSPPSVSSQSEFQLWMCETHNKVNQRLGKPLFNCKAVALRWPSVECDEAEACALSTR